MKEYFCTAVGLIGGVIASLYGGWDAALQTLIIFMAIDYITGLIVAGVFHASPKTETGADPQGRDPADRAGCLPSGCRDGLQLRAGRCRYRVRGQ